MQTSFPSVQSFAASGTHTTLFNGATTQTVDFVNPDSLTGSHFAFLLVEQQGGSLTLNTVAIADSAEIDDDLQSIPSVVGGMGELIVRGFLNMFVGDYGVDVQPTAVRLGGALSAGGTFRPSLVEFFGTNQVIRTRTDYKSVLITGDSVHFDGTGTAQIAGDLTIAGDGLLDTDSVAVTVNGNLVTQDQGRLRMDVEFSTWGDINVAGDVTFGGGSTDGLLTSAMLTVSGNFQQLAASSATSFAPSGSHRTWFDGAANQTVSFANPDSLAGSHFSFLLVEQQGGSFTLSTVAFADSVEVDDDLQTVLSVVDGTGELIVRGPFSTFIGDYGVDIQPAAVRIGGTLTNQGTFRPTLVEFFGSGTQYVPRSGFQPTNMIASGADVLFDRDVSISGTLTVSGNAGFEYEIYDYTFSIGGDLIVEGSGNFNPTDNYVIVDGNLETRDFGTITMGVLYWENEITVAGNATFGGGSTSGLLVEGILRVGGSFTQTSANSTQSFAPTAAHVTVLDGSLAQQVQFANPDAAQSHFGGVTIAQTGTRPGVTLMSDVVALDYLSTTGDSVAMQTITGTGRNQPDLRRRSRGFDNPDFRCGRPCGSVSVGQMVDWS